MSYFYYLAAYSHVGDDAHSKYLYAAMMCHDDLGYGAHAHSISTPESEHTIFAGGLIGGALCGQVYTMLNVDVLLSCYLIGQLHQSVTVGFAHVGKSGTGGHVGSVQRILRQEVDVVGDNHDVSHMELGVGASCSIAYEEGVDSQFVHDADGKCDLLHAVTFVIVEASFHGHHILASQTAKDELATMSFYGGDREMGYLGIGDAEVFLDMLSQMTESCS